MMPTRTSRFVAWLTLASFFSSSVIGANVDLAQVPLVSTSSKIVRPNVMFILDDSGSMNDEFMPDGIDANSTRPCFRNFGYNRIYFNPNLIYELPKNSDGTNMANANIASAWDNGFASSGGPRNLTSTTTVTNTVWGSNINLTNNNPLAMTAGSSVVTVTTPAAHGLSTGATVRFNGLNTSSGRTNNLNINGNALTITVIGATQFRINTNPTVNTRTATSNGNFGGNGGYYQVSTTTSTTTDDYYYYSYTANPASPPSSCNADGDYTKVTVNSLTAAQKQNYANWYSYYRSRIMMMKASAGRAFSTVDDKFRVGFTTISETGTNAAKWLGVSSFNATQKASWYSKLYASSGNSYTPLRGALSKAGRYYAGTLVTGNADPVQYSCQKNFAILTTDGYWNKNNESATYGPKREDNSTNVGDQDSDPLTSPAPMYESGAYSNTLADVARYYWKTDLRTTAAQGGLRDDGTRTAVSANIKDSGGVNDLPDGHQHMNTITLGLGMTGVLSYPADEAGLIAGTVNWPDPQTGTDGSIPARLDDLWHAGINGGGTYAPASDPEDVVDALRSALASISDTEQAAAAAATSSLEPVEGDNFAYVARFTTVSWSGDLEARTIDTADAAVAATPIWSAQSQLDTRTTATTDDRNIYTWNAAGTAIVPFTLANVNSANFSSSSLSQWTTWNATQKTNASADAMVNYLRGRHEFEMRTDATHTDLNKRLYRKRLHVMGDIVNSSPVYVKKPPFRYSDTGYAAFVGSNASRASTVYAGGNDGMLHAYDAETGAERWAYVPRMLHGELYKLADSNYAQNHRYYVDGVITVGDAFDGTSWHTVLIAGLGGGGKGYFALDITNPSSPTVMWEYTNANLGYSYGNPILTKRASDGTWVVMFASGYNNTAGDSQGRLFMLDAFSGTLLGSVATTAGTNPDLSGIAKINSWVLDALVDNSTQYVYGGDLGGNLWRFDINTMGVQKLGQTSATPGARPITSRPEVARIRDSAGTYHRIVYVGTGRYLGANDVSGVTTPETTSQMMVAVKDSGTNIGTFTTVAANMVQQTINTAVTPRTIPSPQPVNWASKNGWYVNLPVGERINVDPRLQLGALAFVANKPVDDYCAAGGSAWLYALDYRSGGAVTTAASNAVGEQISTTHISTGFNIVLLEDGTTHVLVNVGEVETKDLPNEPPGGGVVRRVGYREIN